MVNRSNVEKEAVNGGKSCSGYIYNHSGLDLKGVAQSDPQTIRTLMAPQI